VTALVVFFLIAHGLVHLAVWLPRPQQEPEKPPPFAPDHSALLTRVSVTQSTSHRLAAVLAVASAVAFVITGLALAIGGDWVVPLAVLASLLGLALKVLYFNPWLSFGVLIDLAVLSSALGEWPVSLT
jgi:hypothetical protein